MYCHICLNDKAKNGEWEKAKTREAMDINVNIECETCTVGRACRIGSVHSGYDAWPLPATQEEFETQEKLDRWIQLIQAMKTRSAADELAVTVTQLSGNSFTVNCQKFDDKMQDFVHDVLQRLATDQPAGDGLIKIKLFFPGMKTEIDCSAGRTFRDNGFDTRKDPHTGTVQVNIMVGEDNPPELTSTSSSASSLESESRVPLHLRHFPYVAGSYSMRYDIPDASHFDCSDP